MTHTVHLASDTQRAFAKRLVDRAPAGFIVTVKEPTRSGEQNAKMHAMLTDISIAKPLGRSHIPNDWKVILMHEVDSEMLFEMDLRGKPFPIGYRSSQLTVRQMSDFIEYLYKFGAEHAVRWSDMHQEVAA